MLSYCLESKKKSESKNTKVVEIAKKRKNNAFIKMCNLF